MTTALDTTAFRNAMARFASGVTVVTTLDPERKVVGFTASAFSSVSLTPPLLLVCLQKDADSYDAFMEAGAFAVSVLAAGQEEIARRFATKGIDKMEGTPSLPGSETGIPLIEGALATFECKTAGSPDAGDHTILIGEVIAVQASEHEPLLFYDRRFGRFQGEV
jgi:flavin reductase ActVB